jgi:nucleotide-binding universal stress UspA family protein
MAEFRLLVPLDGSRLAEHSLAYLGALRRIGTGDIVLLSVVDESEDFGDLTSKEASERESNVLRTYLDEVAADIKNHLGASVNTKVVRGKTADCILEEARSFWPDLLVMSTHGRSGMSRWRLGSVVDKVIRNAERNVLAIGPKARARGEWLDPELVPPFRSILVPLDGSALAENALPVAKSFADAFNSKLHLIRAVPIPMLDEDMPGEAIYTPDLLDSMVSSARTYLTSAASRLASPEGARLDVLVGPPAPQIEDYATLNNIDLVVMTSHGRGGIARAALGSVTDRLLGGPAPVLVVRAEMTPSQV